MSVSPGKISTTVTGPNGPMAKSKVFLDLDNNGQITNHPWQYTCADGTTEFKVDPAAEIIVRQIVPAGLVQTLPTGGMGVHCVVGPAGEAVANFVNAAVAAPQPSPPPVVSQPTTKIPLGFNIDASWDTKAIIAGAAQFAATIVRYFPGGGFNTSAVAGLLAPAARYAPSLKSVVVLNFNESGNLIPTTARLTAFLNAIPPASQTSIIAFEFGNEVNDPRVFSDTPANYAAAFKLAYQILVVEKGYQLIVSNVTTWGPGSTGQTFYEALQAQGVFALKGIFAGLHAYTNTGSGAIAYHKSCMAWLFALGVAYWCTELGLHCNPNNLPAWAKEIAILVAWAVVTIRSIYFPLMPTGTGAGPQAVFDSKGQPNQPFFAAVMGAVK